MESFWRTRNYVRHDHQATTMKECPPYFPDREVKSIRVEQCPDILLVKVKPLLCCSKEAQYIVMADQCPFRFSRRTRGIDNISQIMNTYPTLAILKRLQGNLWPIAINADNLHDWISDQSQQMLLCEQKTYLGILEHKSQAFWWINWIQWNISSSGFQNTQDTYYHLKGALHT